MNDHNPPVKIGSLAVSLASQLSSAQLNSARELAIVPIEDSAQVPSAFVKEIDRDIPDRVVAWYVDGQELIKPELRRAMREDERVALERRRRDLLIALAAPADGRHGDRCAGAVAAMLAGFPATMGRHDTKAGTAMVACYLSMVGDRPPWAIVEACRKVRSDEAGIDRNFCPSEAAFCAIVRNIVWPYELQLRKTKALLNADAPRIENKPPARPRPRPAPPADGDHTKRALWDLTWRKKRREPPVPSVFELNPETWNT